jgi:DNA repair protein RadC
MENPNQWEFGDLGEVSISYIIKDSVKERPTIINKHDVYKIAMAAMDHGALGMQEQFLAIYLNRSNRVLATKVHFIGGLSSVVVDIRVIAATALSLMASALIVCHNHPSGNLEPSEQDKRITIRLKESLKLFDIDLMDHMILSHDGGWISFVNRGLL